MIQLGLLTAAIAAVLIGPEIARTRRHHRQAQQNDAALRAKLATMPGSEWVADYPGPLPPMVAAIAAGEVALWPMPGDDPWITMSGELPPAMQDPAGDSPWPDDTKAYRRRIDQLGDQ
jgi:hypothetical protein